MCLMHRAEEAIEGRARDGRIDFAEPGVGPHYGPDRTVAIEHIEIHLDLDPQNKRFSGEAWIRYRALASFAGTVSLDLDEVQVDGVTDLDGNDLDWRHDDAELNIRKVPAAGTVIVKWHGANPRRGLYFTGPTAAEPDRQYMAWTQCQDEDAHVLLPCHDHPGNRHPWTIRLTGPKGYTLLSNGTQIESGWENDKTYAKFEMDKAMPAYLFTAVCAQLEVVEASFRGRSVRYLVPTGEGEAVERAMGQTPKMMELFSDLTGVEFPWPRYDQVVVHDFIFGGMENTSCTTMTRALLVDARAALDWDADSLVSHELAHQWFGDLVTCQDWSQGWLNESWATFMETVWTEHHRGADDGAWFMHDQAKSYFEEDGGRYRRPIVTYTFKEPIDVFDRHLYEKGACVLNTLRTELGPQAFWAGVRHYLAKHAHQPVHTRHFQRALEEATGRNLDRFFADWVYSPAHPVLEVKLGTEDGLLTVSVKQTQSGDGVPQAYHLPLRLEVRAVDGRVEIIDLKVKERERTYAIPFKGDVQTVRVDPGFRFLSKLTLSAPKGWLVALLADPCPVLATRAARALLEDGTRGSFDAVVEAMKNHPHQGARGEIASMVGKRGGPEARDALLADLDGERDARVRRRIAEALGAFREPEVASRLIELIGEKSITWQLLGAGLSSLGKTRDPRAIAAITPFLEVRSWAEIAACRAIDGLANTEDPAVIPLILGRTGPDQRDRVRAAAARALGRLADRFEQQRPDLVKRLVELTSEGSFRASLGAVDGLAEAKDPGGIGALERLHGSAPDGRVRRHAYEALASVRAGRNGADGLAALRKRVDELADENHKLRARLDKLPGT